MSDRGFPVARVRATLATTALIVLGGCTTLSGNVKGSFSCTAPDGICAPSSAIDDRALAMIAGDGGATKTVPVGPDIDPRLRARPSRTVASGPRVPVGHGNPRRTQERVLRIVFQPYIDQYGRLHEASAVHAVVESGQWQEQKLAASARIPDRSGATYPATTVSLAEVVDRADRGGEEPAAIDPNLPDPAVVAAARERVPVVDPVAAIRNDVAARLAPNAGRTPPRVVSKSVSAPVARKRGGAGATSTVPKASTGPAAIAKPPAPEQPNAAPVTKPLSETDAVTRVKATTAYQAGAPQAQDGVHDATAASTSPATRPTVKPPVRAAGFPGTITEDN